MLAMNDTGGVLHTTHVVPHPFHILVCKGHSESIFARTPKHAWKHHPGDKWYEISATTLTRIRVLRVAIGNQGFRPNTVNDSNGLIQTSKIIQDTTVKLTCESSFHRSLFNTGNGQNRNDGAKDFTL